MRRTKATQIYKKGGQPARRSALAAARPARPAIRCNGHIRLRVNLQCAVFPAGCDCCVEPWERHMPETPVAEHISPNRPFVFPNWQGTTTCPFPMSASPLLHPANWCISRAGSAKHGVDTSAHTAIAHGPTRWCKLRDALPAPMSRMSVNTTKQRLGARSLLRRTHQNRLAYYVSRELTLIHI
jgi:hypothetical protein